MSFLGSLFLGREGSYNVFGTQVNFKKSEVETSVFSNNLFGRAVDTCLKNSAFRFLTLGYLHVFIHEMGHALAAKLLDRSVTPVVNLYTDTCQGDTYSKLTGHGTLVALAGPLAGVAFEIAKIVGILALSILIPPLGILLGIFLGAGAVIWIFGEAMYALCGTSGDWVIIKSGTSGTAEFA